MATTVSVPGGYADQVTAGLTKVLTASFTRPANTTDYADNDAVNNSASAPVAMSFANLVRGAGLGAVLFGVQLKKTTTTTTAAIFRLNLFRGAAAPTPANDNAAYAMAAADALNLIGWVDFAVADWIAGTNCAVCQGVIKGDRLAIANLTATTGYGLLVAKAAYVPGSAEVFTVDLHVVQE